MLSLYTNFQAHKAAMGEEGATMVEYGIIVALISIIAIIVITALGVDVFNAFNAAEGAMPADVGPIVP